MNFGIESGGSVKRRKMTIPLNEENMKGQSGEMLANLEEIRRRKSRRMTTISKSSKIIPLDEDEDSDERAGVLAQQLCSREVHAAGIPVPQTQGSGCMSQTQIVQLLDMAAKNKITTKNAFDLKLIECLPEAVKNENFNYVGSMLDASAKIYAYRVDKTHQDAYRVRYELNIGDQSDKKQTEDEMDKTGGQKRTKRKFKSTATIETNPKSITCTSTGIDYEDDALFRKVVAEFDEGASTGLLFNQTLSANDGGHVLLHNISIPKCKSMSTTDDVHLNKRLVALMQSIINDHDDDHELGLCRSLDDFTFDYKLDGSFSQVTTGCHREHSSGFQLRRDASQSSSLFRAEIDDCILDMSDRNEQHDVGDMFMMKADDHDGQPPDDLLPEEATLLRQPHRIERLHNLLIDSSVQDLGYFDHAKLSTIKGPNHWKVAGDSVKSKRGKVGRPVRRAHKVRAYELDIDDVDDDDDDHLMLTEVLRQYVASSSAGKLVETQKFNVDRQFQMQSQYDDRRLTVFATRPTMSISRPKSASTSMLPDDGEEHGYEFGNQNDSLNFCAETAPQMGAEETTLALLSNDTAIEADDEPCGSQSQLVSNKLFDMPIPSSTRQKRINARSLKRAMKMVLYPDGHVQNEHPDNAGTMSFVRMFRGIRSKISPESAADLSVPIAFVIFLHMCNEETLQLVQSDDRSDFLIKDAK